MSLFSRDIISFFSRTQKFIALVIILLCFSVVSFAQTNKGDKPAGNKGKLRETRFKTKSRQGDRARNKDVAGRRVRMKNYSSANRAAAHYETPIAAKAARKRAKSGGDRPGKAVAPIYGSSPRNNQNAWKGGPFGGRIRSATEQAKARNVYSNRGELDLLKRMQQDPNDNNKKRKVTPRSASRAYMARRSVNPMSKFKRQHKKGEVAWLTDPAGRKIRGRNYETPRPGFIPPGNVYRGRKRVGDKGYRGPTQGYMSATKTTPRAWKGDIAGRKIRGRNYQSKISTGGNRRYSMDATMPRFGDGQLHNKRKGVGYRSATISSEKRAGNTPLPPRAPGIGAKGVGSFSGNIKAKKKEKGGGSVSGKMWNNNASPLPVKPAGSGSQRALSFQGNIKSKKPEKGGGSVSGKLWNNNEKPVQVKPPSGNSLRALSFQGNIKSHKPEKGGGSVSGTMWNNDEKPIRVEPPHKGARSAYEYPGDIRLKRFNRSYVKNSNAHEDALKKTRPHKSTYEAGGLQVKVKQHRYIKNPSSAEGALKVREPGKAFARASGLQVKVKQYHYVKNPSSADVAMKVREPGKAFARATDYQGNIKMKKFDLFARSDLYPDARFIKTNRNNVPEEKDLLTNFKLWWSKTFKKNEAQPEHLKQKEKKPRYDNGEQGMWND